MTDAYAGNPEYCAICGGTCGSHYDTCAKISKIWPRKPIPCPHDDCVYRDGLINGRPGVWLRLNDEDAAAIVDAIESSHPHRAVLILKRQPWYPSMAKQINENKT